VFVAIAATAAEGIGSGSAELVAGCCKESEAGSTTEVCRFQPVGSDGALGIRITVGSGLKEVVEVDGGGWLWAGMETIEEEE
jgi:hypothetical protein